MNFKISAPSESGPPYNRIILLPHSPHHPLSCLPARHADRAPTRPPACPVHGKSEGALPHPPEEPQPRRGGSPPGQGRPLHTPLGRGPRLAARRRRGGGHVRKKQHAAKDRCGALLDLACVQSGGVERGVGQHKLFVDVILCWLCGWALVAEQVVASNPLAAAGLTWAIRKSWGTLWPRRSRPSSQRGRTAFPSERSRSQNPPPLLIEEVDALGVLRLLELAQRNHLATTGQRQLGHVAHRGRRRRHPADHKPESHRSCSLHAPHAAGYQTGSVEEASYPLPSEQVIMGGGCAPAREGRDLGRGAWVCG